MSDTQADSDAVARRALWMFAGAGLLGIVLLLSTPINFEGEERGHFPTVRCGSVLWSPPSEGQHLTNEPWDESPHKNMNPEKRDRVCGSKREGRLGWALVLAIPTTVSFSVALQRRR
ncbi:hypothetical protein ACWGSE_04865 [Streptomyces diastaticus]|uniref:hypothetical protein n=1 Tax=Streptomyces diastaticus TaxID=1956 RepID=UPI0035DC9FC1